MKYLQKYLFVSFIAFTFSNCNSNKTCNEYCSKLAKNTNGQTIVRLQQQWFINSGFAGEIYAKEKTASKYGIQIEVIGGSDQIVSWDIVLGQKAEFGVAGAEQIMNANEKGANLVIIGVINYKSLACFISKKDKNILKPQDMIGRKIGTMEGSPVDLVYQVLKKKENLEIDKNNEIPTGWVLTGFQRNQYDVYPAFINDEPVTLKLQGIDVNIIDPSIYGVNFIGTVYFCRKELAECCPEIVQSFVNSISDGWDLSLKDPQRAIALLKAADKNIDVTKETESFQKGKDYYKGEDGKILYVKRETWEEMANLLKSIDKLKSFNYDSTIDNRFITWYHSKIKSK